MLQREFRRIHCLFSPVSKTAVKKSQVFSSRFLFSLGGREKISIISPKSPSQMNPNLHSKVAHCCLPRFNATFYIQFWTTSEKTPKTVTFIPNWWIHPYILALCIWHQVMKSQQTTCQEKGACTPNTVTVCCRTTSKDWELPCEPVLPFPARASSNCCSSHCTWVPTPRLAPVSLNLQPKVELAAVWLAADGFC